MVKKIKTRKQKNNKTHKSTNKNLETKITIGIFLQQIPKILVNKRKDGYVKIIEGNCYLRDVFYGVQVLDNYHGAPGKVIGRIKNKKDIEKWKKIISENIKNYKPPVLGPKSNRDLLPNDRIEISIKVATRTRLKTLKHKRETYDHLINRSLDFLENK